jgi:hypothetical protein
VTFTIGRNVQPTMSNTTPSATIIFLQFIALPPCPVEMTIARSWEF